MLQLIGICVWEHEAAASPGLCSDPGSAGEQSLALPEHQVIPPHLPAESAGGGEAPWAGQDPFLCHGKNWSRKSAQRAERPFLPPVLSRESRNS